MLSEAFLKTDLCLMLYHTVFLQTRFEDLFILIPNLFCSRLGMRLGLGLQLHTFDWREYVSYPRHLWEAFQRTGTILWVLWEWRWAFWKEP